MIQVSVYKAIPMCDNNAPPLRIEATEPIPDIKSHHEAVYRPALTALMADDAQRVVDALTASLPGGTLHWILIKLLEREASILRVPCTDEPRLPECWLDENLGEWKVIGEHRAVLLRRAGSDEERLISYEQINRGVSC